MSDSVSGTPPPPSPSESEAPPSYDSLSPPGTSHRVPNLHFPHTQQQTVTTAAATNTNTQAEGDLQPTNFPPPYFPGQLSSASEQQDILLQLSGAEASTNRSLPLFVRIQEARHRSTNGLNFLRKLGHILHGTICCLIALVLFTLLPIAVLVLGVVYLNSCPLQSYIPIFLIVGGLSVLLKAFFLIGESIVLRHSSFFSRCISSPAGKRRVAVAWDVFNVIFNLFLLAWSIAGSYWVYSNYKEAVLVGYRTCDQTLYKITFSVIASSYIFLLLLLCCTCYLVGTCFGRRKTASSGNDLGGDSETSGGDWTAAEVLPLSLVSVENERLEPEEEMVEMEEGGMWQGNENNGNSASEVAEGVNLHSQDGDVPHAVPVRLSAADVTSNEVPSSIGDDDGDGDPSNASHTSASILPQESLASILADSSDGGAGLDDLARPSPERDTTPNNNNGSSGVHNIHHVPAFVVTGDAQASHSTRSLRRQAHTFSTIPRYNNSLGRLHSNSKDMYRIPPDHPVKQSWKHSNEGFQDTTTSYINLLSSSATPDSFSATDYARSNPVLFDSQFPSHTLPLSQQRRISDGKYDLAPGHRHTLHLHLPLGNRQDRRGITNAELLATEGSSSSLYVTMHSDGHSTTCV